MGKWMPNDPTDPMWQMHMKMLLKRTRNIHTAQIIDEALYEWYSERGLDVPNWKRKDPQWWLDYLNELGLTERNEPR